MMLESGIGCTRSWRTTFVIDCAYRIWPSSNSATRAPRFGSRTRHYTEAVRHAAAAGDIDRAAGLIEGTGGWETFSLAARD